MEELNTDILIFNQLKSLESLVNPVNECSFSNAIAIYGDKKACKTLFSRLIQAERDLQQHLKFWMREFEGRWYKRAQKICTNQGETLQQYLEEIRESYFGDDTMRIFELGFATLEINSKRDWLIKLKEKVYKLDNELPEIILTKVGGIAILYNIICYQYNLQCTRKELDYFTVSNEQFHRVFLKALASTEYYPEMSYSHSQVIK